MSGRSDLGPRAHARSRIVPCMPHAIASDLLDTLPTFFVAISPDGKVVHMNRTMREATGYSESEVLGSKYIELFVPESDQAGLEKAFSQLKASREPLLHVNSVITRKGDIIAVEWHGRVLPDEDGSISCICGVGVDITARRRVEAELEQSRTLLETAVQARTAELTETNQQLRAEVAERREVAERLLASEERFRLLAASASDAIIAIDERGNVTFWNDAAAAIFEYSADEMLGNPLHGAVVLPEEKPVADAGFASYQSSGQGPLLGRTIEHVARTKAGALVPVELSLAAIPHGSGWHTVGIVREISERKSVEAHLRQVSSALEQIADHAIITDRHGRIEYANRAFEQVTGYTREQAIGQTPRLLKSGRQEASFYAELWETILAGRVFHGDLINRNARGELYFDEMTISPLKDEAGAITHFVATGRDVTERKMRDPLTGLSTRALLLERIDQAIARKRRDEEERFALLFIDLDSFRLVGGQLPGATRPRAILKLAHSRGPDAPGPGVIAATGLAAAVAAVRRERGRGAAVAEATAAERPARGRCEVSAVYAWVRVGTPVPVLHPLPDVPPQIRMPPLANSFRRLHSHVLRARTRTAAVHRVAVVDRRRVRRVRPRIRPLLAPSRRCIVPLRLCRQPPAIPDAERFRLKPCKAVDRTILVAPGAVRPRLVARAALHSARARQRCSVPG